MSRLLFPHSFPSLRSFSVGPRSTGKHATENHATGNHSAGSRSSGKIQLAPKAIRVLTGHIITTMTVMVRQPLAFAIGLWWIIWLWNWPVAIAIAAGTIGAIAVYLYQLRRLHVSWFDRLSSHDSIFSNQKQWQEKIGHISDRIRPQIVQHWSQCWTPGNRPLTISLLLGGAVASVVATMALIYRDVHSQSLVLAMGLQFLVVLGFSWNLWRQPIAPSPSLEPATPLAKESINGPEELGASSENTMVTLDQLWADLISKNTSVRLIAIYRSVNWVQSLQAKADPTLSAAMNATKLTACFRVMLSQETNPSVQHALREGLMNLQPPERHISS